MTYEQLVVRAHDIADESGRRRLLAVLGEHGVAVLADAWSHADETLSLDALCRLFALPAARKDACRADDPRLPGYTAYGYTRAIDTGIPNLLEMWRLSDITMRGIPEEEVYAWEDLARAMSILRATALRTLSALELALSTPDELTGLTEGESFELYGIHYPKELLGTDSDARRQSVHRDSSLITLLPRATHPGLYVELDSELIPLDPAPGDITIVSGSALEYVTAGRIPPCTHTVETPRSREEGYDRTALAFFVSVSSKRILRPLTPFRGSATDSEYPAISIREFESERYGNVYRK